MISLIAAVTPDWVMGRAGQVPWHEPLDLQRFRKLTAGKPCLMGRRTFESLPNGPLPQRANLVLTRSLSPDECRVCGDGSIWCGGPELALELVRHCREVMVIGGAAVFALLLPQAQRLYLTRLTECVSGDVCFPQPNWNEWLLVSEEDVPEATYPHSFRCYDRIG